MKISSRLFGIACCLPLFVTASLSLSYGYSQAAVSVQTNLRKGVLYGKVVDLSGKPVAGATVALQQTNGKVLTWGKTNDKGEYALAADPKVALNLKSHCKSLLETCAQAVGDVAMAPVKAVGGVVSSPGSTAKSVAVSVASGTPAPLAAQAVGSALPNRSTVGQTAQSAGGAAAGAALGDGKPAPPPAAEKGLATLRVSATGFKDAKADVGAYWLEPPVEDKSNPVGVQAWMETIQMAPTAGDKKSDVQKQALTLSDGTVTPTLAPVGSSVNLKVKLNSPPGPDHKVRVFARLASKDEVVELTPDPKDKTLFAGSMTIPQGTPAGQSSISIGALRAEPVEVKLNQRKDDPLLLFVHRLDDMNAAKPYGYDPFIMASENRVDVPVTVLAAKPG